MLLHIAASLADNEAILCEPHSQSAGHFDDSHFMPPRCHADNTMPSPPKMRRLQAAGARPKCDAPASRHEFPPADSAAMPTREEPAQAPVV